MPDITTNLGLKKPLGTETVTRAAYNENLDILDNNAADKNSFTALQQEVSAHLADDAKLGVHKISTTADITFYVATTGSDITGDGSSENPFASIQHAVDLIPQVVNHTVIIGVSAGSYDEVVAISGFSGKGKIWLVGGSTLALAANYSLTYLTVSYNSCEVAVNGFTATSTAQHGFIFNTCQYVVAQYCRAVASASNVYGIYAYCSFVYVGACLVSNHGGGLQCSLSTVFSTDWEAGSENSIGLFCIYGGTIGKSGTQPSGVTAESTLYGGVIR